jgi:hypothetical protein
MPEEDLRAGQVEEPEEVSDVVFPTGDEPSGVVEPGKEAFDLPTATIATEGAAILRRPSAGAIGRDHFDAVLVAQLRIQEVTVVAAIAD